MRTLVAVLIACPLVQPMHLQARTGIYRGRVVTYEIEGGRNIYQSDIVLDKVEPFWPFAGRGYAVGVVYPSTLWPAVNGIHEVPYNLVSGGSAVTNAISIFNNTFSGVIQWVPWSGQADFVEINLDPADNSRKCDSSVGRVGGKQLITGAGNCTVILHLLGHTVGLWHELTRPDRDAYVQVFWQNIVKSKQWTFIAAPDNVQTLGSYDYSSQMHYVPTNFTSNGGPTFESIPPGIRFNLAGANNTYSAGDIDAINRLYGAVPTAVTITSNPPGLNLLVDGVVVTAPRVFNWALNSTHALSVPTNTQTISTIAYKFGNWSDLGAATHNIVVSAGSGVATAPATAPAMTVYTANFVELVPFSSAVSPASSGSISLNPSPSSNAPLPGHYYRARQQVVAQANPTAGYNFYGWNSTPSMPVATGDNPHLIVITDRAAPVALIAQFTTSPVYTVTTNAQPSTRVQVDGVTWYAPKRFALPFDPGWTGSSTHTIAVSTLQVPYPDSLRYLWQSWSDLGARSHNVVLPSNNGTFTANLKMQRKVNAYAAQSCAGKVTVSPSQSSAFYDLNSSISIAQVATGGWSFTGWTFDLNGTANPQTLNVSADVLAVGNYNINASPLSITSLRPSSVVAGSTGFNLTINGAGFSSTSNVFISGIQRTFTFISSTQLRVAISAADIATPGGFQVAVQNLPPGAGCAALAPATFLVKMSN